VAAKSPLVAHVKKFQELAAEAPEAREARNLKERQTRALTSSLIVAEGVTPEATPRLFGPDALITRALARVKPERGGVGTANTIRRDLPVSRELITAHLKVLCKGQKFSLVTDAASFKDNGKAVAIVLTSLSLERPVLLVLHHPDEDGVYDHTRLADDVRAALLAFEVDLATQVRAPFFFLFFFLHFFCAIYSHVSVRSFARWATMSPSTRLLRRTWVSRKANALRIPSTLLSGTRTRKFPTSSR
jgi:hypothetical protein